MSKYCCKIGAHRLTQHGAATNLQCVKSAVSVKPHKTRYACPWERSQEKVINALLKIGTKDNGEMYVQ